MFMATRRTCHLYAYPMPVTLFSHSQVYHSIKFPLYSLPMNSDKDNIAFQIYKQLDTASDHVNSSLTYL